MPCCAGYFAKYLANLAFAAPFHVTARFPACAAWPPLLPGLNYPVAEEQYQGADNRQRGAAQVEAGKAAETGERSEKTTDEGPDDANRRRDDEAARILARHDQLGNDSGDQSKNDP